MHRFIFFKKNAFSSSKKKKKMIQYNTLSELTLVNHDSPQKVNHLLEKLDKVSFPETTFL